MIVETFLRWAETAKTADRARAANALGRAYCEGRLATAEAKAAEMAMIVLLDDPAPQVRAALAEAISPAPTAPRRLLLCLASDQPEVACHPILAAPGLDDADLIDLALEGTAMTRMLIAARPVLSRAVCAALAEVAEPEAILCLLENGSATIARITLERIAERYGHHPEVRSDLLNRCDLSAVARHRLASSTVERLSASPLIRESLGPHRLERLSREARDTVSLILAGEAGPGENPALLDHLLMTDGLTPSLLLQVLCTGQLDFFASALARLSGEAEKRVRALLATGRPQAISALMHASGLAQGLIPVFLQAVILWREHSRSSLIVATAEFCETLMTRCAGMAAPEAQALLRLVERMTIREERQKAARYASGLALQAA